MLLAHVPVLSSSGHRGARFHVAIEGPRLSEALPSTFKLDIGVISVQSGKRKESGTSHMRSVYGPGQAVVPITSSHIPWLGLSHVAPPNCKGNWTL